MSTLHRLGCIRARVFERASIYTSRHDRRKGVGRRSGSQVLSCVIGHDTVSTLGVQVSRVQTLSLSVFNNPKDHKSDVAHHGPCSFIKSREGRVWSKGLDRQPSKRPRGS